MKRKKVLLLSYNLERNEAVRVITTLLKKRYDLSKLYVLDYGNAQQLKKKHKKFDYKLLLKFIKKFDYILISSSSYEANLTYKLCDRIKSSFPNIKIILGGQISVAEPKRSLRHVDAICIWEGYNILELMDYFEGKKLKNDTLANFMVNEKKIKATYSSLGNYDNMPFSDYSKKKSFFFINNTLYRNDNYYLDYIDIVTTKGCLFNCSFCSISYINEIKRKNKLPLVAKSSITKIIERLINLKLNNKSIKHIIFYDDNFFYYSAEEIDKFVKLYNQKINLPASFHVDPRSQNLIGKFKKLTNLNQYLQIWIGLQTGSEKLNRDVYNRIQSNKKLVKQHKKMLNIISKKNKNIRMEYFVIYNNPLEKKQDIIDTINLMLKLRKTAFKIYAYSPIPSTKLEKKLSKYYTERTRFFEINSDIFSKYGLYYFIYFLINRIYLMNLDFLLPRVFKPNFITDLLNNKFINHILKKYLDLSYKRKYYRDKKRMTKLIFKNAVVETFNLNS